MITEVMWETAWIISEIVELAVNAVLVVWFYAHYMKKKPKAYFTGISYFIVMSALFLIPFTMPGVVAYVLGAVAVCVVSIFVESSNVPQKVFLALTIYLLQWISTIVALLPWYLISNMTYMSASVKKPETEFVLYVVSLVLQIIIQNVLLFIEIMITNRLYSGRNERMEWRELTLLVSPYIAIIAGYWICAFMSGAYVNTSGEYIFNSYPVYHGIRALFGVIAFLAAMAVIYSYRQVKNAQAEVLQNALVARQMEELSGHVHMMERVYADIRGIRHDVNDHIMVLGNLLETKENEQAVQYLNEWQNGFPMPEVNAKTGNPVTDIVISEKRREAEEAGIAFSEDFHYPSSGRVESVDIGVILNNALSNAIRAAKGEEEPRVSVRSWMNRNLFLIEVRNSFSGILPNMELEFPQTSKDDKEAHGYGLLNMKRITEKYYGTIQLEQDGDFVVLTAMLMIAG